MSIDPKTLPHNDYAEGIIIGALMADRDLTLFDRVASVLSDDAFFSERNRLVFGALRSLANKGVTPSFGTVIHALTEAAQQERVAKLGGIAEFLDYPAIEGIEHYCEAVAETARQRRIAVQFAGISSRAIQGNRSADLIAEAQSAITNVEAIQTERRAMNPAEIIAEAGGINRFFSPASHEGIQTGFPRFDAATMGLGKGEMVILAGRPGTGKSAFAGFVAANIAAHHNVAFLTYEMTKGRVLHRMACGLARVDSTKARRGQLTRDEISRLNGAMTYLCGLGDRLLIDDHPEGNTAKVAAFLRQRRAVGTEVELLILDYLQIMRGMGRFESNRVLEIGQITRGVKLSAKEFNIPILALCQMSRAIEGRLGEKKKDGNDERRTPMPMMSDLRESGNLENDSDGVIVLVPETWEELTRDDRNIFAYFLKWREGGLGKIEYTFHANMLAFDEQPRYASQPREYAA